MAANPEEYYNTPSEWGSYGYTTMENIINEMKASSIYGPFLKMIPRYDLVRLGKLTIREFNMDLAKEVKAIELELGSTLTIILPTDFIDYVRVSFIDDNGELKPIAQSDNLVIAKSYLQDNDSNILFDNDGNILTVDLTDTFENKANTDRGFLFGYSFAPNADLTKSNPNKFRVDKQRGLIQFNSNVEGKSVVLEYISDGLDTVYGTLTESDIKIHKKLEEAFIDAIYYKAIKNGQAPLYEKTRARKEYYNSKRLAKRRINALRRDEIIQAFSGASKWV